MARPRQPTDLLILKGKKHLTKSEINKRKTSEINAPFDKIRAPSYLNKKLKKEFNKIAKELKEIGIMTNLDIDSLARFIIAREFYNEITKQIIDNPDLLIDKDMIGIQDKLYKQCRSAASDLGLTISSRCKLVIPTDKDKNKPQSKWSEFIE